jgi:DNA-binding LytR/AlgR family response regulator
MTALTCLLVDDEAPARQRLRRMIEAIEGLQILGEADNGVAALEQIALHKPAIVFLDIEMPELDGLGVAAALPSGGPAIVFVTAYDEHALKAFELAAVDYVVKPVQAERLSAAVDRVRARGGKGVALAQVMSTLKPRRMAVRCGAKFVVFDPERVCAVLSKDHYSAILVDGKELLADDPLDELARRLGSPQLLRVHRGAIVNLDFLRELVHEGDRRYVAVLSDAAGTRVQVSRERLPALKAALGLDRDT